MRFVEYGWYSRPSAEDTVRRTQLKYKPFFRGGKGGWAILLSVGNIGAEDGGFARYGRRIRGDKENTGIWLVSYKAGKADSGIILVGLRYEMNIAEARPAREKSPICGVVGTGGGKENGKLAEKREV